jgi:hypothetical protein
MFFYRLSEIGFAFILGIHASIILSSSIFSRFWVLVLAPFGMDRSGYDYGMAIYGTATAVCGLCRFLLFPSPFGLLGPNGCRVMRPYSCQLFSVMTIDGFEEGAPVTLVRRTWLFECSTQNGYGEASRTG